MLTWSVIAGLSAVLVSLGTAFDRLMLRRQKVVLHTLMVGWWVRVHEASLRELSRDSALKLRAIIDSFRPQAGMRSLIIGSLKINIAIAVVVISYNRTNPDWHSGDLLPLIVIWVILYAFALIATFTTDKLLAVVVRGKVVKSILVFFVYVAVMHLLAVLCLGSLLVAGIHFPSVAQQEHFKHGLVVQSDLINEEQSVSTENIVFRISEVDYTRCFILSAESIAALYGSDYSSPSRANVSYYARVKTASGFRAVWKRALIFPEPRLATYALVMFLGPTIIMFMTFGVMVLAKFTVTYFRRIALHFLELTTDVDPQSEPEKFIPATLLGFLFALITAISKAVLEILKYV